MGHHGVKKVFSGDFLPFINVLERLEVQLFSAVDGKNALLGCMRFLAAVHGVATGEKNSSISSRHKNLWFHVESRSVTDCRLL